MSKHAWLILYRMHFVCNSPPKLLDGGSRGEKSLIQFLQSFVMCGGKKHDLSIDLPPCSWWQVWIAWNCKGISKLELKAPCHRNEHVFILLKYVFWVVLWDCVHDRSAGIQNFGWGLYIPIHCWVLKRTNMGIMHVYAESDEPRACLVRESSKQNYNLVKAELGHVSVFDMVLLYVWAPKWLVCYQSWVCKTF